jgi:hypothetical protein
VQVLEEITTDFDDEIRHRQEILEDFLMRGNPCNYLEESLDNLKEQRRRAWEDAGAFADGPYEGRRTTTAFAVLNEIVHDIENHVVLDDEDLCRREHEAFLEVIADYRGWPEYKIKKREEGWEGTVLEWLQRNLPDAVLIEPSGCAYIDERHIHSAMLALGLEEEDIDDD